MHAHAHGPFGSAVVAHGGVFAWKDGRETPDTFQALLEYPKGFLVSYATSFGNDAPSFSRYMGKKATLFNLSPHRRTVEGLTRSLGWPTVSIVPLSGTNPEVVITICWEISWYQYRIVLDSSQVRLAQRGHEPDDLDEMFRTWNAELNEAGLVVPRLPDRDDH